MTKPILACMLCAQLAADEPTSSEQQTKFWLVTLGGMAVMSAYGAANWDYFSRSPHMQYEGWFGHTTDYGGADKAGHLYTTYLVSRGLGSLYEYWDFEDAALYGALSGGIVMSYIELGDAFSEFGFAYEDIAANAAGALLGYLLQRNPMLASKFDLRWEYSFEKIGGDFVTDYEHSRYLLAMKLNGFDALRTTPLRHVELHLGYYTRGYTEPLEPDVRHLYYGIGFNLTDLLRRHGFTIGATVLNYYQIPQTTLGFDKEFTH